jgi:hypothetical protein
MPPSKNSKRKMPENMCDATGVTVIIGDWVAFAYGANMQIGKITRFNEKSMIINRKRGKEVRKVSEQVIKLTQDQVVMYCLTL